MTDTMTQLFDVGVPDISKHLKKKFETGELDKDVVVSKMEITTPHEFLTFRRYALLPDKGKVSRASTARAPSPNWPLLAAE